MNISLNLSLDQLSRFLEDVSCEYFFTDVGSRNGGFTHTRFIFRKSRETPVDKMRFPNEYKILIKDKNAAINMIINSGSPLTKLALKNITRNPANYIVNFDHSW